MRRQHALSITSQDVRDRTQTIDSYAGDLDELPVYTANINKNPTFGLRVRTSSETEPLKKEEKVISFYISLKFFLPVAPVLMVNIFISNVSGT